MSEFVALPMCEFKKFCAMTLKKISRPNTPKMNIASRNFEKYFRKIVKTKDYQLLTKMKNCVIFCNFQNQQSHNF